VIEGILVQETPPEPTETRRKRASSVPITCAGVVLEVTVINDLLKEGNETTIYPTSTLIRHAGYIKRTSVVNQDCVDENEEDNLDSLSQALRENLDAYQDVYNALLNTHLKYNESARILHEAKLAEFENETDVKVAQAEEDNFVAYMAVDEATQELLEGGLPAQVPSGAEVSSYESAVADASEATEAAEAMTNDPTSSRRRKRAAHAFSCKQVKYLAQILKIIL